MSTLPAELEREHGRLIYSFDMKIEGKAGIEEVNVNALDGRIVAVSHEGPRPSRRKPARRVATPACIFGRGWPYIPPDDANDPRS